ncbi:Eco29kI family restriction endonuclease [Streptomyces sp. NPDC058612]|uniref:Eco29kI family restriction endonuclease n=1 Tax=Streptomyces sp. NPDC058612 TaxID=3346555 RepID=UPI00365C37B3
MTETSEHDRRDPSAGPGRDSIYDPLRRENLGRSVLWALVSSKPVPLGHIPNFRGSGIYAIYYAGPHELYTPISSARCDIPIYVGKADPEGSRKGQNVGAAWEGTKLRDRLRQHGRKIDKALDLDLSDFFARYLPADDLFTPMAERLMISDLQPVWNVVLEGFGVNRQGSGREDRQLRPKWHEMHPGIDWADGMPAQRGGPEPLRAAIVAHLECHGTAPSASDGEPGQPGLTDLSPI